MGQRYHGKNAEIIELGAGSPLDGHLLVQYVDD